jgi:hypothetical protein
MIILGGSSSRILAAQIHGTISSHQSPIFQLRAARCKLIGLAQGVSLFFVIQKALMMAAEC